MSSSSSTPIPTLSITCLSSLEGENYFDHPDQIKVSKTTVTPSDATVDEVVIKIAIGLAKDYIFSVGKDYKKPLTLTMTASAKKGVELSDCSDAKMIELMKETTKQVFAAPASCINRSNSDQIKQVENVDEEIRKQAVCTFGEQPMLFFDQLAFCLFKMAVIEPVQLNLEVSAWLGIGVGNLTTGSFRFPHLLLDVMNRYRTLLDSDQAKVCIVGPGLQENRSPQFVELFGVLPKASFLLLDNSHEVIQALQLQVKKVKRAFYDLAMYRSRMDSFGGRETLTPTPDLFAPLFHRIGSVFQKHVKIIEDGKMIAGRGKLRPLMLEINPDKVDIREFDIIASKFNEKDKGTFNVIVGTCSIVLAVAKKFQEVPTFDPFSVLSKFLELLKEKGSLYVDSTVYDLFFDRASNEDQWKVLEAEFNASFKVEEIPVSQLVSGTLGKEAIIKDFTNQSILAIKRQEPAVTSITTLSVTVITCLPKKQ